MPITGMLNFSVTSVANLAGIFSKTIAKQPTFSRSKASSISFLDSASSLALTLYVPNL